MVIQYMCMFVKKILWKCFFYFWVNLEKNRTLGSQNLEHYNDRPCVLYFFMLMVYILELYLECAYVYVFEKIEPYIIQNLEFLEPWVLYPVDLESHSSRGVYSIELKKNLILIEPWVLITLGSISGGPWVPRFSWSI